MVQGKTRASAAVRGGFSIFELVLVMVIIATLAAIAAPRYAASATRYRADAAARRIAADLSMARARARTSGSSRAVSFSVASNDYQIPGVPGLKDPSSDYSVSLSDQPYGATLISANLGGDQEVVFDGWGVPDSGGAIVLKVGDIEKTVLLDAETGKATVQ